MPPAASRARNRFENHLSSMKANRAHSTNRRGICRKSIGPRGFVNAMNRTDAPRIARTCAPNTKQYAAVNTTTRTNTLSQTSRPGRSSHHDVAFRRILSLHTVPILVDALPVDGRVGRQWHPKYSSLFSFVIRKASQNLRRANLESSAYVLSPSATKAKMSAINTHCLTVRSNRFS